jgi:tetratricopeptide (TPR) repeat protein
MKKADSTKSNWIGFWGLIIAALIGAIALIWVNDSKTKKITISASDQSTVYQTDRDLIIYPAPIPGDIKSPPSLGILEFDSNYKRARSYMLAGDYNKAADLFKSIYEIKPDYPTLALYYGACLSRVGKKEEALATYLSIPPTEKYKFINSDIGGLLFNLKRYNESVKYFKLALNDYKRNDVLYWDSRAFLIITKNKEMSINNFINDVDEFVEVVDNDLRNLISFKFQKDTKYEIDNDEVRNAILGRKYNAFILLYEVSLGIFHKKKNYNESLNYALRAADHLEGPVFGVAHLFEGSIQKDEQYNKTDKQFYLKFLQNLSLILWHVKNRDYDMSKLNSIMERIENHNNNSKNQEISDFAMLIRSFYGDSKSIRQVKKANFKIIYRVKAVSGYGLKSLSIESPNYLLGKKEINIGGNKEYRYDQVITINPEVVLKEKPYFRTTIEDINGKIMHFNPHPWIEIKDNK